MLRINVFQVVLKKPIDFLCTFAAFVVCMRHADEQTTYNINILLK